MTIGSYGGDGPDARCPCGEDAPHEGESCSECDRLLTPDGYVNAEDVGE